MEHLSALPPAPPPAIQPKKVFNEPKTLEQSEYKSHDGDDERVSKLSTNQISHNCLNCINARVKCDMKVPCSSCTSKSIVCRTRVKRKVHRSDRRGSLSRAHANPVLPLSKKASASQAIILDKTEDNPRPIGCWDSSDDERKGIKSRYFHKAYKFGPQLLTPSQSPSGVFVQNQMKVSTMRESKVVIMEELDSLKYPGGPQNEDKPLTTIEQDQSIPVAAHMLFPEKNQTTSSKPLQDYLSPSHTSSTWPSADGSNMLYPPESPYSDGELSFVGFVDPEESLIDFTVPQQILPSEVLGIFVETICQNFLDSLSSSRNGIRLHINSTESSTPYRSHIRSNSSRTTPSSARSFSKRKQNATGDRDSCEDDENAQKRTKTAKERDAEVVEKLFACPYSKYDITRYSGQNLLEMHYRSCATTYSVNISRLKQHLYRVHRRPEFYCSRCFSVFEAHAELEEHLRDFSCQNETSPFEEKMTQDQMKAVKRRFQGKDQSKLWFEIYNILFPGSPKPDSPFADNVSPEAIRAFLIFFSQNGSRMLNDIVSQRVNQALPQLANQELAVLQAIHEESISHLVQQLGANFHTSGLRVISSPTGQTQVSDTQTSDNQIQLTPESRSSPARDTPQLEQTVFRLPSLPPEEMPALVENIPPKHPDFRDIHTAQNSGIPPYPYQFQPYSPAFAPPIQNNYEGIFARMESAFPSHNSLMAGGHQHPTIELNGRNIGANIPWQEQYQGNAQQFPDDEFLPSDLRPIQDGFCEDYLPGDTSQM